MKKWKIEFEEVVTNEMVVEAETREEAQAMLEEGNYDPNSDDSEFAEVNREYRDLISIKEHEDDTGN